MTPLPILLLRRFLFTCNRFPFTFPGTAVGFCTLATYWQTFTMTEAAIAGDIKQTLDAHLHFRTKLTFYFQLFRNCITNSIQVIIIPFMYFLVGINFILTKNVLSGRRSDTIYIGKTDFTSFAFW